MVEITRTFDLLDLLVEQYPKEKRRTLQVYFIHKKRSDSFHTCTFRCTGGVEPGAVNSII